MFSKIAYPSLTTCIDVYTHFSGHSMAEPVGIARPDWVTERPERTQERFGGPFEVGLGSRRLCELASNGKKIAVIQKITNGRNYTITVDAVRPYPYLLLYRVLSGRYHEEHGGPRFIRMYPEISTILPGHYVFVPSVDASAFDIHGEHRLSYLFDGLALTLPFCRSPCDSSAIQRNIIYTVLSEIHLTSLQNFLSRVDIKDTNRHSVVKKFMDENTRSEEEIGCAMEKILRMSEFPDLAELDRFLMQHSIMLWTS